MTNNASMEETLRAEVECLRKVLAEKDKEIQHLHELRKENEAFEELATNLEKDCERLQKQLDIAEMALKEIEKSGTDPEIKTITTLCVNNFLLAHKALKEIEELN